MVKSGNKIGHACSGCIRGGGGRKNSGRTIAVITGSTCVAVRGSPSTVVCIAFCCPAIIRMPRTTGGPEHHLQVFELFADLFPPDVLLPVDVVLKSQHFKFETLLAAQGELTNTQRSL